MDNRGELNRFVGMQASEDSEKRTLDQEIYNETLIKSSSIQDSTPSKIAAEDNLMFVKAFEDK